jgi:hypothetical protein
MNDCETIRQQIDRWLDGELVPTESETVRAHVGGCGECGEVRRQLEKLQLLLRSELASEAARVQFMPFWREVQQRINQKRPWHVDLIDRVRDSVTAPRVAWVVPVAIMLVLVALSLNSYLPGWRFGGARNNFASVESIDAYGRDVALLREDDTKTTVIWLYQNEEGENEAAEGTSKSGPAF